MLGESLPCLGEQRPLRLLAEIDDLGRSRDARRCWMLHFGIWLFESILHEEVEVVALVEHLALDVRMVLAQQSHLAVLLCDELLAHRCYLDVDIVLGQVEVRPEVLDRLSIFVPVKGECVRFVFPVNAVEVEETRKFPFAVVSEVGKLGR